MTEKMRNIYLGTWQFEDQDDADAKQLIEAAHRSGISKFDTAFVYAGGRAEELLGQYMTDGDEVVTKLPASNKHELNPNLAYPTQVLEDQARISTDRLRRVPDVVLLHNWNNNWEGETGRALVAGFRQTMGRVGVQKIGISLPNGYDGHIEDSEIIDLLDYIELPFNDKSPALTIDRIAALCLRKKVLVRSLFQHGADVNDMPGRFNQIIDVGGQVVVGASRPEQVYEWRRIWEN